MSDQPSKALKTTVHAMGVVLLLGFVWVVVAVINRAGDVPAASRTAADCAEITLPAIKGAKWQWQSGEWIMQSDAELRRYSACGELRQTATLRRD